MEVSPDELKQLVTLFSPVHPLTGRPLVGDLVPIPLPSPTSPDAGDYVKGTTVTVTAGVPSYVDVLYKLPDPGGDIGWNNTTKAIYVV